MADIKTIDWTHGKEKRLLLAPDRSATMSRVLELNTSSLAPPWRSFDDQPKSRDSGTIAFAESQFSHSHPKADPQGGVSTWPSQVQIQAGAGVR
jgi:hypothetical protein